MGKNLRIALLAAFVLAALLLPLQAAWPVTLPKAQQTAVAANLPPSHLKQKDLLYMADNFDDTNSLPNAQILVNRTNPLPADFVPRSLVSIKSFVRANGEVSLRAEAAQALREMLNALRKAGITDIYANSGYRNFARQGELYKGKVATYLRQGADETAARAQAARWVAPPGESEHQTGLAVDLSTASLGYDLVEAFAQTAAGLWLAEHCAEYGFIVRYTAEKEHLTGVALEPWHFRYVGEDHAFYLQQFDLCLEEYHALLREQSPLIFINALGEKRAVNYSASNASLPDALLSVSLARYGGAERITTLTPPSQLLFDAIGHWAEPYIKRLHNLGVVGGYLDGSFRPNAGVNRGEFITAFSRLPLAIFAAGQDDDPLPTPLKLPYEDISADKYYYQPLLRCYKASLVQVLDRQGQSLLFAAEQPLLRGEVALLLAQALNIQGFVLPAALSFKDVPPAAGLLYRSVELLNSHKIVSGDSDGFFHPERGVSRAEMSALFCRLLDIKMQEPVLQ